MRSRCNSAGRALACLAVLLACVLVPRAGQVQAPSPGIFSTFQTDLIPDIGVALEPATMRSRAVQVDTAQVTAARLGQETLRLNLFDDVALGVQIDRVRPTRSGYFIAGRPEGVEWGEVRLVVNGPVIVGTVVTPEAKYTIRFGGSGRHIIRQVDPSAEPPLHDDAEISGPSVRRSLSRQAIRVLRSCRRPSQQVVHSLRSCSLRRIRIGINPRRTVPKSVFWSSTRRLCRHSREAPLECRR